ncbi:MAG: radical SAM protein [Kiritimatiellae bacterium]|nr:radical SAM protein [Kiritimatiellia bacterium]
MDEIACAIAAKYECVADEVREDVEAVVGELVGQRFVEVEGNVVTGKMPPLLGHTLCGEPSAGGYVDPVTAQPESAHYRSDATGRVTPDKNKDWTPLGDFYARHGLPSELHIDLTDGCNEKCVHCYLPHGGAHYIDKDITFKVLKEFREAQGLTVYVSGGECMLHKNFEEILRYARSLDLNIIVMSNLTLCDEKMIALLKEIDPQFVNVSLYAVTEAIHDSITQVPGSCRKTKAAIDALQAAGVHIRVATPFMRENKGCVEELKEYTAKRCVHLIADGEIFGQIDHSCVNQDHALSVAELEELISAHKDVFSMMPMDSARCECEAKVCDIGDARLNLDAKGMYYPCDGFHGAIIGDTQKDSLWDVWTGEPLNKLRALKNKDFGVCASCIDRAWCKACPMRNFNETGSMFTHARWRCEAAQIYRKTFEEI